MSERQARDLTALIRWEAGETMRDLCAHPIGDGAKWRVSAWDWNRCTRVYFDTLAEWRGHMAKMRASA